MSESTPTNDASTPRTDDRCAGVRVCASDLAAHGVRVCGCVYTAHHTPVLSTAEEPIRCADGESRTPTAPEPDADADLAARQRAALNRLARAHRRTP